MALKAALYRGPSSRLETLIEKIQANNKEINSDACSVHTSSPSFSPSISEGATTPNSTLSQQHHHKYHNFSTTLGVGGGGGLDDGNDIDDDSYIDINQINNNDNNKKMLHYNHHQQQQQQQQHQQPPYKFFSLSDEEAGERERINTIRNIEETERSYSLPPSFLSPTSPTFATVGSVTTTGLINKRLNRKRAERHLLLNNNNNHNYNYYHLRRPINHDLLMDDNDASIGVNNKKSQKSNKKLKNNKELAINNDVDNDDDDDETRTTTTGDYDDDNDDIDGDDINSDNSKNIKLKNISQKRKRTQYNNDNDDNNDVKNNNKNNNNDNNNDRIELNNRNNNYNNKLNNNNKLLSNNNNMETINTTVSNNNNNKGILLKDILKKNAKLADKVKNCNGTGSNNGTTTTTDGSYPCQFCDKSFPRLGYLKKHEQSHAEHLPFKCEYCARLFKHKRSRDRHTKLHTGDRRYRCPHCEAAFSRSDHLKIHMKTHDNQKPFQCTICNRGYNTAAALTSHIQNHKKQAALMGTGLQPLNYSPRSTGSTSSSAGSLFGMRHPKSPLSMSGTDYCGSNTGSPIRTDSKQSSMIHHQNLSCIYCSQNSFNDLDQLNHHIQTAHKNLSRNDNESNDGIQNQKTTPTPSTPTLTPRATPTPTSITPSLTPVPSSAMLNFPMSCDYCTMKFTNISIMFQHMKTAHIDQMKLSNFHENFDNLPNSFGFPSNFGGASTSPMIPAPPTITTDCFDDIKIKKESPSPNSTKQQSAGGGDNGDSTAGLDKDENLIQLRPTDLSQPKKHLNARPASSNINENNSANEKFFQRTFLCNQCNEALPDFHSFRNHLKLHITQKMGMICQHCGITLHDKTELDRHVMSHFLITTAEFNCSKSCKKSFTKVDDLRTHLFEQHSQIVYKCTLCTEVFDTKIAIQVHLSCTHVNETKTYQCSACMKQFRNEEDFAIHVKSHLTPPNGCIQCMFCRTICTSQLEMHFHLAAHTQQFRCPSCPETFQVEFLLERHIQTQHTVRKDSMHHLQQQSQDLLNGPKHLMQEESEQYTASQQQQRQSPGGYAARGKNLFQIPNAISIKPNNKFYSPLQVNINANSKTHLKYGGSGGGVGPGAGNLNQRYDAKKSLLNLMYNNYHHHQQQQQQQQQEIEKLNNDSFNHSSNFLLSPTTYFDNNYDNMTAAAAAAAAAAAVVTSKRNHIPPPPANIESNQSKTNNSAQSQSTTTAERKQMVGFSCGMCERNDFRTESEVNTHRKIVHNLKTGVSLRCAYCSGNFKSRSELEHHMKACHNSMGKHKCLICDEIFPSPAILAEHKLQHSRVGRSGKCVHCSAPLNDIATFKLHLSKHIQTTKDPMQCICCRQTLNSDFEVELHARYHTKTPNVPENGCVLCLEPLPSTAQTRLCDKCDLKHKFTANNVSATAAAANSNTVSISGIRFPPNKLQQPNYSEYLENKCHLCKIILPHQQRLQEHLVEHTFAGCEERGYSCYICSSVFTVPGGLLNHMNEHGQNSRPYDCNICQDKFFFRAELDNHLFKHQLNDTAATTTTNDFIDKTLQLQSIQQPIDMIKTKELKTYHHPASTSHHHSVSVIPQNQLLESKNRDTKDLIKNEQKPSQHDNSKSSRLSTENDYKLHQDNNENIFKTEIKIENKSMDIESNNNNNENITDGNNEEDEYVEIEKLAENTITQEH